MAQSPPPVSDDEVEPPRLRRLRLMVSALILVLIVGMVTVVAALVISIGGLTGGEDPQRVKAEAIALPPGEEIVAAGEGPAVLILVTRDGQGVERVRRFDAATGAALSETRVTR